MARTCSQKDTGSTTAADSTCCNDREEFADMNGYKAIIHHSTSYYIANNSHLWSLYQNQTFCNQSSFHQFISSPLISTMLSNTLRRSAVASAQRFTTSRAMNTGSVGGTPDAGGSFRDWPGPQPEHLPTP